jgi:glycine cleavage system H protein
MVVPDELRYTDKHEWMSPPDGSRVRVGMTAYAQAAVGEIVFVELPEAGTEVAAGEPFGEVESAKCVSELYAPVSGRIVARNDQLMEQPGRVNSDPYGAGWLVDLEPTAPEAAGGLLDARAYADLIRD